MGTDDIHCVAYAMYAEARGEGRHGMLLVGSVIKNRMKKFKKTACKVILQKGQFDFKYNRNKKLKKEYSELANVVLDMSYKPLTSALYFTNKKVRLKNKKVLFSYKNHLFY